MTEFSPDQDELASAYLDGEATHDERTLVEGDPELLARVETLRGVREALSAPTPAPSASARDAAVARALRASPIVDLRAERARRRMRIASIAAAVVIAVGAAGLLIRLAPSSSSKKSTATAAGGAASSSSAAQRVPEQAGGTTGAFTSEVPGTFPLGTRDALGSFNDQAALTDAARTQVRDRLSVDHSKQAASAPTTTASRTNGADSVAITPACVVTGPPNVVVELYGATATLQGRAVQIDVFSLSDDTLTLIVTDAVTCTQVFTQSV